MRRPAYLLDVILDLARVVFVVTLLLGFHSRWSTYEAFSVPLALGVLAAYSVIQVSTRIGVGFRLRSYLQSLDNASLSGGHIANATTYYGVRAMTDALACSVLQVITGNPASELYIFYAIPVVTVAVFLRRHIQIAWQVAILLLFTGATLLAILNVATPTRLHKDGYTLPGFAISIFCPRFFLLLFVGVCTSFTRGRVRTHPTKDDARLAARYNALVSALPQMVFAKNSNKEFTYASNHFAGFLDTTVTELVDPQNPRDDYHFFPKHIANNFRNDDDDILSGRSDRIEKEEVNTLLDANDRGKRQSRTVFTTKVPIVVDNQIVGVLGTVHDLTVENDRKRRLFRWFLHDFPQPLDAIRTRYLVDIENLASEMRTRPDDQERIIKKVLWNCVRIRSNIAFLLVCGRGYGFLSGGAGDLWSSGVDTPPIGIIDPVDLVLSVLKPIHQDVKFFKNVRKNCKVQTDYEKCSAILYMLISNAIHAVKPCEHGGRVCVSAEVSDGSLVYRVNDNGRGINASDAERIFEMGHSGWNKSGFGLYIARGFARLSGGDVILQRTTTNPDYQGAEFVVTIKQANLNSTN